MSEIVRRKLTIRLDEAGHGDVLLDDVHLPVRRVVIAASVNEPPTVTLTLVRTDVELEIDGAKVKGIIGSWPYEEPV